MTSFRLCQKRKDGYLFIGSPKHVGPFQGRVGDGKFAVALLFHEYPASFCFLAEYFASHGVIAVVALTKRYYGIEMEHNQIGLETQMRDYEIAL